MIISIFKEIKRTTYKNFFLKNLKILQILLVFLIYNTLHSFFKLGMETPMRRLNYITINNRNKKGGDTHGLNFLCVINSSTILKALFDDIFKNLFNSFSDFCL